MKLVVKTSYNQTSNEVTTDDTGVVVVVFRGPQTGETVRQLKDDAWAKISKLRAQGRDALILVDINALVLNAADSAGRAEAKKMINLDYDAAAVVGPTKYALFMSYILRGMTHNRRVHFFTTERQARNWLTQAEHTKPSQKPINKVGRIGWLFATVLILIQVATFLMWQQAIHRNETESQQVFALNVAEIEAATEERVRAYTDALHGFKGLFRSSDFVSKNDFTNYYDSLDLEQNYPGLRSLAFISAVPDKDINEFVALMRREGIMAADGTPFAVKSETANDPHFILTYVATGNSPNIGLDIGSIDGRQEIYAEALASEDIYASGLLDFQATAEQAAQQGFFITTPVVSALNPAQKIGIVNAVFNYGDFFNNLFTNEQFLNDVDVRFVDPETHTAIYESDNTAGDLTLSQSVDIPVANRNWELTVQANGAYGISEAQVRTPVSIVIAGQIISTFLIVVFLLQWRARRQALDLADTITQDLRHERNLAVANDQKSSAILSSIGDAVFAIDAQGRIKLFNPAAQQTSGITEAEALGKPYAEVLKFELEATGEPNYRFITEALAGQRTSMTNHTVLIRPDGKRIPVADSAAPIRDSRNEVVGAIVVFRDVSKEYQLDKAKSEFVSLASHQLRTPLSAINWYGELLLNGDAGALNKDQHEYIKEIAEGSQRMVDLVNSLLDVSRIEVGKLADQPEPTNINELIESLEKELTLQIKEKNLVFRKQLEQLQPVIADPKQLRMIIQNLMSNAVKYTPDNGSIMVALRTASPADKAAARLDANTPMWLFAVKDTGYGIPKDQQDKIFTKLYRAENVRKLDVEGTGLGLYIVKEVVEKLGGRVWFESMESVGTTFYAVLPFGKMPAKADDTIDTEPKQGVQ